jgi:hypothetical protein
MRTRFSLHRRIKPFRQRRDRFRRMFVSFRAHQLQRFYALMFFLRSGGALTAPSPLPT